MKLVMKIPDLFFGGDSLRVELNGNRVVVALILVCCLTFVASSRVTAQERQWGGHGAFSPGGSSGGFSVVPSVVADVLLVPSLTKVQQGKIRTLYMDYRAKSTQRMEVMRKLGGGSRRSNQGGGDWVGRSRSSESDTRQGPSRGAGKSKDSEKSGDGKRRNSPSDAESSMDNASSNLRRTMFMSMLKEYQKFQTSVIAILSEKQHAELKEIAEKAGSPDYFKVRHYDIMNAD